RARLGVGAEDHGHAALAAAGMHDADRLGALAALLQVRVVSAGVERDGAELGIDRGERAPEAGGEGADAPDVVVARPRPARLAQRTVAPGDGEGAAPARQPAPAEPEVGAAVEGSEIELPARGERLGEAALELGGRRATLAVLAPCAGLGGVEGDDQARLIRPHLGELAQVAEHLAVAGPAVDLTFDTGPQIVGVDGGDDDARLAQVAAEFAQIL